jgi:hypothetical protein
MVVALPGSHLFTGTFANFSIDTEAPVLTFPDFVNCSTIPRGGCLSGRRVAATGWCLLSPTCDPFPRDSPLPSSPALPPCSIATPHTEVMTLVVRCPSEANGVCRVSASVSATSTPAVAPLNVTTLNNTAATVWSFFPGGASVVVDLWAVDGVGNRATARVMWTVDITTPVTVWPPLPPVVNDSALQLSFNCSKPIGCSFMYGLNDAVLKPLGNSSLGSTTSQVGTLRGTHCYHQ